MDLTIRSLDAGDLRAADAILMSAFSPESRLADLRRYLELQPDGWFLASTPAGPAGMVGAVDYGPFAYIGLMGVHPRAQHQGIGTALMRHLLDWLDRRGTPMARLDASAAGYPLYRRLGFVECDRVLVFRCDRPARLAALPEGVRPLGPSDLPALLELDTPVFGTDRRRVLAGLVASQAGRAFVTRDRAGGLTGCLFALPRRLGPWIAQTSEDAGRLLQAALTLDYSAPILVSVPGKNPAGAALLEGAGFSLMDASHRHMRRGGTGLPGRRELVYGQMSFAIG